MHGFACKSTSSYKCISKSAAGCQHTMHSPLAEVLLRKRGQLCGKDVAVWVAVLLRARWGEQGLILRWEKQQLLSFQVQAGRADERPAISQGTWAGSHRASHWWCWRGDTGGSIAAWQHGKVVWNRNIHKEKRDCNPNIQEAQFSLSVLQEEGTEIAKLHQILH